MISPNKAVIDDCPRLEEELNKHDIKTYVVLFKHSRTLCVGHNCVTLDLHRVSTPGEAF
jgi:hypothetical protein